MRRIFFAAFAVALMISLGLAERAPAQSVQGTAELGYLQPVIKRDGKDIVTTIKVKNTSKAPIRGLKIEEYWYDKDQNPLTPGSSRLTQPLAPGAIGTVVIRMPADERMMSNNYVFSHDGGKIRPTLFAKFQ